MPEGEAQCVHHLVEADCQQNGYLQSRDPGSRDPFNPLCHAIMAGEFTMIGEDIVLGDSFRHRCNRINCQKVLHCKINDYCVFAYHQVNACCDRNVDGVVGGHPALPELYEYLEESDENPLFRRTLRHDEEPFCYLCNNPPTDQDSRVHQHRSYGVRLCVRCFSMAQHVRRQMTDYNMFHGDVHLTVNLGTPISPQAASLLRLIQWDQEKHILNLALQVRQPENVFDIPGGKVKIERSIFENEVDMAVNGHRRTLLQLHKIKQAVRDRMATHQGIAYNAPISEFIQQHHVSLDAADRIVLVYCRHSSLPGGAQPLAALVAPNEQVAQVCCHFKDAW